LKELKREISALEGEVEKVKSEGMKAVEDMEKALQKVEEAIMRKEEEIEEAERFPPEHPKYPGRPVIEVRKKLMKKMEWLNMVVEHFQDKYQRRMTEARLRFNMNVSKAFEKLSLKGFKDVFLDQDYNLHVIREEDVSQPVETLSASEKLTISLILMLAAKETFLPDFPLFIIDELTLSYDPERFNRVLDYIGERVPYVVVTALAPDEREGKLKVEVKPNTYVNEHFYV